MRAYRRLLYDHKQAPFPKSQRISGYGGQRRKTPRDAGHVLRTSL